ncbi:ribonucleoside-diphosphate reductase, adenosylcobalamin-dependent [candidate division WOR-1 bacterium RIFCSPHIGHO2_01_FULL_53_15]|uniref:Vitamin B12-dependent ribonucleotide reductase n=1 Tax=candidate division WOR-1 bacterium RIFCSPHIGHO2_01_FULL_53_15 TaxID=1802564 RepID=A0A1F4Q1R2_UNCSA|nr:MAG: ribonucleoside-diphosphate reductase, adenosylcobalamin-dependent [candidate division WOR-1 bacterium RIFCSPHIGHO2_01_FULL_53_15]OGC13057.1 MAG: ribonucleoside-diphosphate reductase, adenosylcobalamin-dependent [candidate division WOR-1 bacterium RIFCSPHIGHO2_02_FULL_53_26]
MELSPNALTVLEKRYLLKDDAGNIIETPDQLFHRVARGVAKTKEQAKVFYGLMSNLEFLPNTPTLMNAGTPLGQLSACFVLPVDDDLGSIFTTLKHVALIQQSGGGTGFSFSHLRPKADIVRSTHGVASGPVSFMNIFNATTDVIKQGGKRRGANMGILSVHHPDILEFIAAKRQGETLSNFNISVAATDRFMQSVKDGEKYELINPRTQKVVAYAKAPEVFDKIAENAWQTGDPGLIFIDEINRRHPAKKFGTIEATNPCGELPLLPYESCNLGSINLTKMLNGQEIDWLKLERTIKIAVPFLDNVIDKNRYPVPEIKKATLRTRKIGLGVMGFAELLIEMGVRYNTEEAIGLGEKLMAFIYSHARKRSKRNYTVCTIAPTGTISLIANCSSGIEPLFAAEFVKEVLGGVRLHHKLNTKQKDAVVAALEIAPEWHVRMQAAFQKHVDNAVSKTINLPEKATVDDVRRSYLLAYELKCKGITVYRYGSKPQQVLYLEDSGCPECAL